MARILVIGKYYPPYEGGTEAYTRDVCEMLARDHDVTAVVYNHEPGDRVETVSGVKVIRCSPEFIWSSQPVSFSMFKAIDLAEFDLVHFHAPNFFANAILLLKLLRHTRRVPLIITHHMDVYGRKALRMAVMPLYHRLVKRAAAVLVTSQKNAAISRDLPSNASIAAIPLGIEVERFELGAAARQAADEWRKNLVGNARTIAFIGRHARYKGLDVLIAAVARLPDVHCFIGGDGPYRQGAAELAASLGIGKRVHFFGYLSQQDKLRLLAASDVFAFPSTEVTEAFGISQLEAMAMGVPVVSSDLPTGVTDVAIDGVTALLSRPGDVSSLELCLSRVLADRALAERLSLNARQQLSTTFTKSRVMEQTRELFNRHLN